MTSSRTHMTKLNAKVSTLNRIVTLLCNFICRSVFIQTLGSEYLGVGGMFGNVFSIISLCELGFGEAASQAMYKPLAQGNSAEIHGILRYYTKVYRYISLITVTLSMAFMPFLPYAFPDIVKISNYRAVYLLFVIHQMLTFCFAPKRSLVMSDQRMYVIMTSRTITVLLVSAAQILCLLYTGNYLLYIFLRIFFLAVDGAAVEAYANKKYKLTNEKRFVLSGKTKSNINNNTKLLFIHRIGGVINNSTDSILLSSCLGLSHMGIFSNYSLIINSLGSFISLAVNAATASVGNLGTDENAAKSEQILTRLCFANFYMMTNCTSLLLCLINPAISLWIGKEMCFSMAETAVIIACFYMSYIRDPVQIFLRSYGVFKSTRYILLIRGLLNLFISYMLVKSYGVAGVFAGTLISTVAVPFVSEPYMLFKHGFGTDFKNFMRKYLGYILSSLMICSICLIATATLGIDSGSIVSIFTKGILVLVFTNILLIVFYARTDEFKSLIKIVLKK